MLFYATPQNMVPSQNDTYFFYDDLLGNSMKKSTFGIVTSVASWSIVDNMHKRAVLLNSY